MKKVTVIGIFAASVLTSGLTAYAITYSLAHKSDGIVASKDNVPTHFTSYQQEKYPDLTYAAENAVQAVVSIDKKENVATRSGGDRGRDSFFEFFGIPQGGGGMEVEPRQRESSGSGVLISPDGYIVSNNHVVDGASELKVTLTDGRVFSAKIIGADPTTDIALIKIDTEALPFLTFGNSNALRLGEWVLAIGSPFSLSSTITAGIVSAKARNLGVTGQFGIESFIQTDAAVNPGNSGGALVNTKGEVVGINTVIKSPTGSYAGYSFAVPSSIVKKVITDIKEYGVVQRAMLGIQYREVNDDFINEIGKEKGITERGGVYVAEIVSGGAAEAAGIKIGDVITQINDIKLDVSSRLQEIIATYRPNDKIKVYVKRNKETKLFDVVLRNKAGKTELMKKDAVDLTVVLGGEFAEINDKVKKEFKIEGGIRVVRIKEGGILSNARIRLAYIITHINGREIKSINDLTKITSKVESIDGVYPDGRFVSYSAL